MALSGENMIIAELNKVNAKLKELTYSSQGRNIRSVMENVSMGLVENVLAKHQTFRG